MMWSGKGEEEKLMELTSATTDHQLLDLEMATTTNTAITLVEQTPGRMMCTIGCQDETTMVLMA